MIDVLAVLVDALRRLVPVAERPARLGYDLVVAYATVNRCLMVAGDVVGKVESIAGRARDPVWVAGKGPGGELSDLEYLLKAQLRDLNQVETMLGGRYRDALTDGDLVGLWQRLGNRETILGVLLARLRHNQLPLEGLPLLAGAGAGPMVVDLGRSRAANVAGMTAYLALWRPRERVGEVTARVGELRDALLCGFALGDVLPGVGDGRFR